MKKVAAVAIACGALIAPSAALAHGSSSFSGAYTKNYSAVKDTGASRSTTPSTQPTASTATPAPAVSNVDSDQATRATTTASSTLPFTGIDIVPLAAGGALLLGAGLFVRRLSAEN